MPTTIHVTDQGNQTISGVKTIEDLKTKNLYLNDLLPENSGVTFKLNDGDLQVSNKSGVRFGLSNLSALPFTGLNNIVLTSDNTTIKLPPNKNDFIAMSSEVVYNTGNQTISGNKSFVNGISFSQNHKIYLDGDNSLIISGSDNTPQGMQFILANNENETSIKFDPDYHGLIFQGDRYYFQNQRPQIYNTGDFSLRGMALSDEVVSLTGNQTISGNKTFINNISVSGTGIFNAIDLNDVDNLSLSGVDVVINSSSNLSVTNSNVTFSGNNINFENQNNINLAYQFPAWTGIRRYPPADLFSVSFQNVTTGSINYFPFLIKKKVVNPIACVDMRTYSTFDPKIVIGIYSGHYGFENAKLIASGSITGNILKTGIYRTTLNGTFNQGPYILASMLQTGAGSQFRIVGSNGFREHFGINTGVDILHGLDSSVLTNILVETGQVNLKQNIGSGSWFFTTASVVSPVVFLEY